MRTRLHFTLSLLLITVLLFSFVAVVSGATLDSKPDKPKVNDRLVMKPRSIEKMVFIHYKNDFIKPFTSPARKSSLGYELLRTGLKWKTLPVTYVIDPDNPNGLPENFITNAIFNSAEEWDSHTSSELFGSYSINHNSSWDTSQPDGKNELVFGNYPTSGVIAVTQTWGYFSGPMSTREIIEFDIMFDTDFAWGDATTNSGVMDLQNIATHELGHGVGLADLYDSQYFDETMYGYASYGETYKRDLHDGDIAGIQALYNTATTTLNTGSFFKRRR